MRRFLVTCITSAFVLAGCVEPGADPADDDEARAVESENDAGALPHVMPLGTRTACSWQTCGSRAQAVDVVGSSPYGPVQIAQIGVTYSHGFTGSTHVFLEGSTAGEALRIQLSPYSDVVPDPAWAAPPGAYETARDSHVGLSAAVSLRNAAGLCAQEHLVDVRLEIAEHAVTEDLEPGAAVTLRGRIEIDGAGWSLKTDLEIPVVCDSNISL